MCFANGLEHTFSTRVKRQKVLKGSEDGSAHENMIINSEDKPPSGKSRDCFSWKRTKYIKPLFSNNYLVCIQNRIWKIKIDFLKNIPVAFYQADKFNKTMGPSCPLNLLSFAKQKKIQVVLQQSRWVSFASLWGFSVIWHVN